MPNLAFARNLQDGHLTAIVPLPAAASTSVTGVVDLGDENSRPEQVELELKLPALSDTIIPNATTCTCAIESSSTSIFSAVDPIFTEVFTGAGGVGIAAKVRRARLPSNCARYVRCKVTFGASTTDGSAINATFTLRF